VIGYGVGGLAETVIALGSRDPTGVLFDEQTPAALVSAIRTFERNREAFHALSCRKNAERFSQEAFRASFRAFVEEHLGRRNGRIEASLARLAR
jgi:glycogen synthase